MIHILKIHDKITGSKLGQFMERIPYLDQNIEMVKYLEDSHEAEIHTSDKSNANELLKLYDELTANLREAKLIKQRIVKDNTNEMPANPALHDENSDKLHYDSADMLLMNLIDQMVLQVAKKNGAVQREYPTIYTAQNMRKNGYHKNFPQNVYSVSHIPHNYKIVKEIRETESDAISPEYFESTGSFLQPCVCYHCYEELHNQQLSEKALLTAKGRCFRHEIKWRLDRYRRNEFTMREIVYIGQPEEVSSIRDNIMYDVWEKFVEMGLYGKLITATDPFFHYDDLKNKAAVQLMSNAKFELEASSPKGNTSSIASFNYCEDMLCKKFNITNPNGEHLHSGCAAFGIDRWRSLIVDQYGKNPDNWPEALLLYNKNGGVLVGSH